MHVKALRVVGAFLLIIAIFLAGFFFGGKTASDKKPVAEIVGSPCDTIETRSGYQCSFYDAPDGSRKSIWTVPEFTELYIHDDYKPLINGWKLYESPHHEISFSYPPTWMVNTTNYARDGVLGVWMGKPEYVPPVIPIEIVAKNGVSMEDRMKQDMSGPGKRYRQSVILNGIEGILIKTAGAFSTDQESVIFYFDRGNYYITIAAPIYHAPIFDFFTAALLSSVKVQ